MSKCDCACVEHPAGGCACGCDNECPQTRASLSAAQAEVSRLATELGAAHHDRVAALAEVERVRSEKYETACLRTGHVATEAAGKIAGLEAEVERHYQFALSLAKAVGGCRQLKTQERPDMEHVRMCVMDGITGREEAWAERNAMEAERDAAQAEVERLRVAGAKENAKAQEQLALRLAAEANLDAATKRAEEAEAAYGDWMRRAVAAEEAMRGQAAVVMLGGVYDQIRQRAEEAERALVSEEEISRSFSRSARAFEDRLIAAEKRAEEAVLARDRWAYQCNMASEAQAALASDLNAATDRLALVEPLVGAVEQNITDWRLASATRLGIECAQDATWACQQNYARALTACADAMDRALTEWKKGTP